MTTPTRTTLTLRAGMLRGELSDLQQRIGAYTIACYETGSGSRGDAMLRDLDAYETKRDALADIYAQLAQPAVQP